MHLSLTTCAVRSWQATDARSLVTYANNRRIWLNLRDRFPHPYSKSDALDFLRSVCGRQPETAFAIAVGDEAVGSIEFVLQQDIERVSAEIGYWLGEPFWGRGMATEALSAVTRYAVEHHHLTRIFAVPFAANRASCRVLEKAGYLREATLRRSAIKEGAILDQSLYGFVVPSLPVKGLPPA